MSTAKTMAAQYKQRKLGVGSTLGAGQRAFKSSASNLASGAGQISLAPAAGQRLKSTSMSNLIAESNNNNQPASIKGGTRMQRPSSRSALDSIHMGMNAKYAQVQSKVLLQNIRPQQSAGATLPRNQPADQKAAKASGAPATKARAPTPLRATQTTAASGKGAAVQPNERAQLLNKLNDLQEQVDQFESERGELRQQLEREREQRLAETQQLKQELQDRAQEHERQQEDYHQRLLEAYELADQNRRAADNVLAESRQRDEEARKKIQELEQQLGELKEFVTMKEEMSSKMSELREQIREERERYEEKTRALNQMFESEKIRLPLDGNSNYFRRANAPQLQSMESVDNVRMGRSEHDLMYGSKLSTRMQDTARSAWKKSRKFASSVITGGLVGGGLSACRRNSRQRASVSSTAPGLKATATALVVQQQPAAAPALEDPQLTSVVEVGRTMGDYMAQRRQMQSHSAPEHSGDEPPGQPSQMQQRPVDVHVDANNKLTIVTKFSQLGEQQAQAELDAPKQPNSCSSERSRCESSSSGRGTDSAGSRSGELTPEQVVQVSADETRAEQGEPQKHQQQPISPAISSNSSSGCASSLGNHDEQAQQQNQLKRHRRRSSLFKASKVFGGSQASLNKLRSFFAAAALHHGDKQQPARVHKSFDSASAVRAAPALEQLRIESLAAGLSGQALEDMLRESGQGGGQLARLSAETKREDEQNCDVNNCANFDKRAEMPAKKCQEQQAQPQQHVVEPFETARADGEEALQEQQRPIAVESA